ncbi:MAG: c-type cytochrome [Vicinamibacterales bacterium]
MTPHDSQPPAVGFGPILLVCALAGVVVIGAALTLGRGPDEPATAVPPMATEDYGRRLLTETTVLLGQDHPDPERRFIGNRLQCGSCHLDAGTEPGTLSLLQAFDRYPRFSGRDGGDRDIRDRINGCMTRSMNGRPLPVDSPEMIAMAAYVRSLQDQYDAMGATRRAEDEPAPFETPDRRADPDAGKRVFDDRCATCHGADGLGLPATTDLRDGYLFPPLWGPDSFNDGAGMHRVLTAARFIKARMPLGQPDLTDDEAFDVAAYINVQPRPQMAGLEADYPDKATKPVDSPYGPWADPFPAEQHKLGPFRPIEEWYKAQKASAPR